MAQSNIDIKIIAEFLGKSAFKQADTAANKLNKTVKSLGQSFGLAFGGAALGYAIKSTIKDFADAERETQQLTNTVKNLGLAFAAPEVDAYVQSIGKLYGVTGDQAVPAMQALLTATGSVSRSTKIMNVALDLAASRNADVASVAKDLASAYVGNTKGLNQYKLGLTKAELAALSFEEILDKIGSQTLGAADEAAKTLSGQLAILAEVSNQAKERIGGGLFQALGGLAGPDGAGGAAKNIENLSIKLTNAITGFGYLVQEVKIAQPILVGAGIAIGLAWAPWLTAIGVAALAIGAIGNAMRKSTPQAPMNTGKLFFPGAGDGGYAERLAAEKKAEAAAAARAKKLEQDAKAAAKAQKESLKLAKAKAIFDLQKIQIEAALKGKLSEEDKIRLNLLKAIEEENIDNADKYQKALEKSQEKTKELAALLATVKAMEVKDPFSQWSVDPLTASINALTTSIGGVGTAITASGKEWSSFTGTVATTVIQPNLQEFSSSFTNAINDITASTSAASTAITTLSLTASTTAATAATAAANSTATALTSTSSSFTNAIDGIIISFGTAVTGLGTLTTSASKTASDAAAAATATNNTALASTTAAASKAAIDAAAAATAAANAALLSTSSTATEAIGSSTTSATNSTGVAIATSGAATANTIIGTSQAAADALDKLYSDSNTAITNATTVTVTDFMATSSAALSNLRDVLATEAANYAAAAAATSAQAAADRADLAGAGNAGSNVSITVNTGIGDPNAIAEAIAEVITDANNRGTLDVLGFK